MPSLSRPASTRSPSTANAPLLRRTCARRTTPSERGFCVIETITAPAPRKHPLYERWRWQIFAVTWLAYAGFYLTRKSFAVAKIDMGKPSGLGLANEQLALIDG